MLKDGLYKQVINNKLDIAPYSYQQEILDRFNAEREVRSYYRNLVIEEILEENSPIAT